MWSNNTRFSSKILFSFTHNKWAQTIWILFVKLLNFSSLVTSFAVSHSVWDLQLELQRNMVWTLVLWSFWILSSSQDQLPTHKRVKTWKQVFSGWQQQTQARNPHNKSSQILWSSSMKWSVESNTKSNLAPIEKMLMYDPHEISQKTCKILKLSSIYSGQARRHLKPEWKWANLKAGFLVWNDPDPWLIRALQPVRNLLSLPSLRTFATNGEKGT
jgi:hypothetical protein